jgi:hypothetical protein
VIGFRNTFIDSTLQRIAPSVNVYRQQRQLGSVFVLVFGFRYLSANLIDSFDPGKEKRKVAFLLSS